MCRKNIFNFKSLLRTKCSVLAIIIVLFPEVSRASFQSNFQIPQFPTFIRNPNGSQMQLTGIFIPLLPRNISQNTLTNARPQALPMLKIGNFGNKDVIKKGKKSMFTKEEDAKLRQLVESVTEISWPAIARFMPGRTARQCRERWVFHLSPNVSRDPWSEGEDALLNKLYADLGPKWSKMVPYFKGRTDYAIRHRYDVLQNRVARRNEINGITRFVAANGQNSVDEENQAGAKSVNQALVKIPSILELVNLNIISKNGVESEE